MRLLQGYPWLGLADQFIPDGSHEVASARVLQNTFFFRPVWHETHFVGIVSNMPSRIKCCRRLLLWTDFYGVECSSALVAAIHLLHNTTGRGHLQLRMLAISMMTRRRLDLNRDPINSSGIGCITYCSQWFRSWSSVNHIQVTTPIRFQC